MPQEHAFFGFHVDHIISRKHGGKSVASNLALACFPCNVAKGTDLGSTMGNPRRLIGLYHPREHRWTEHFKLHGARIAPLTEIGEVTARLLRLNSQDRLIERRTLAASGLYPSLEALAYLRQSSEG
jgi:hypothetical protein